MSVFLLEEDLFFADGLRRIFARHGLNLTHLAKAEQALARIGEEQPRVILLDLRLSSSMTGFEMLEALKQDPRTKKIPVMVWSHVGSAEDMERCFALGACEYFLKGQHEPREVAAHVARLHGSEKEGFTLAEWVIALGCFFLVLGGLWWQVQRATLLRRDDGQMQAIRRHVSTLIAAREERAFLQGCVDTSLAQQPLYACRLCKDEACRVSLPATWSDVPAYERESFSRERVCEAGSTTPCHVSLEADGTQPRSLEAFKIRFFLARDRDGLKGGRTHTINAEGVVE